MDPERGISMNEFKTVVEAFRSDMKKMGEVITHRFDRLEGRMDGLEGKMGKLQGRMDGLEGKIGKLDSRMVKVETKVDGLTEQVGLLTEQVGLLMEGQVEIKAALEDKVSRQEFAKLEKRVVRLERRTA